MLIFSLLLSGQSTKEQFTSSHKEEQKPDRSIIMVKSTRRGSFHFNDCAAIYSVKVRISQVEDLLSSVSDVKMKNVCKMSDVHNRQLVGLIDHGGNQCLHS